MPPTLSVVIPIYNEPRWIGPVVEDLAAAVQRSPFEVSELIIVDDGSGPETRAALQQLAPPFPLRIIHQPNSGRLAARRMGVESAHGEMVLLIDSRVSIRPGALAFVGERLDSEDGLPVWNAHVDIDLQGNPFARFWDVLTSWAFREYAANPRTTSYGLEEFDRFPKGMTCFLAPRDRLLAAMASFRSQYEDPREANDDTPIIRTLAAQGPINISPGFSCLYRSRDSLPAFLRHAYHRGSVFVDGYGQPGTRYFPVIAAFYPASVLALLVTVRRPRIAAAAALAAPLAAGGAAVSVRRSVKDGLAVSGLALPWLGVFAAGMWRGLWLALRPRLTRRSR